MELIKILSKNEIKIIAAISMVIDHIGMVFFPQYEIFRIVGRIAFPIFSFSIFEGCRYTHKKLTYFLRVFILGVVCAIGYYIFSREFYGNILITFSLSICIIFSIQYFKKSLCERKIKGLILGGLLTLITVVVSYFICSKVQIDYGFFGVIAPVFAEIFDFRKTSSQEKTDKKFIQYLPIVGFTSGLVLLSIALGGNQFYCLFAVLVLLMSNGKIGKHNLKYFFYIFYPAHLVIIEGIAMLSGVG